MRPVGLVFSLCPVQMFTSRICLASEGESREFRPLGKVKVAMTFGLSGIGFRFSVSRL